MRAAFTEIVDYAGLFPPATCSMADAARQYDSYRRSADRWMLGRFVIAAIRLQELGDAIERGGISIDPADPWRLSVVMGAVVPAELGLIAAFRGGWDSRGVLADSIEFKVGSVGQVLAVGEQIPREFRRYFEVPNAGPYRDLVQAIGSVGAFAKIRTGGTTPELFPAAAEFTTFLMAAVRLNVPFKATAGLHHPFRGEYPISYEPNAERQLMYGFVNVLIATAELVRGGEGKRRRRFSRNETTAQLFATPIRSAGAARDIPPPNWRARIHDSFSASVPVPSASRTTNLAWTRRRDGARPFS